MERPKAVARNTVWLVAGEGICRILAFLTFILVARHLGVKQFGQYSFVFAFVGFFDILAMFGMNSIVVREMAADEGRYAAIFKNALFLRTLCVAAAITLACAIAFCMPIEKGVKVLICLGSLGLLVAYRPIFEAVFRLRMTMGIPAAVSMAKALLFLIAALGIAWMGGNVLLFVLASVLANLAGTVVVAMLSLQRGRPSGALDWKLCKGLLRESLPMIASGLLTVLYLRIDVLMLTFLAGFDSVGFYSAATRLAEALLVVPAALMMTVFPILSRHAREDRKRFGQVLSQGFRYLLVFVIPLGVLLTMYSGAIVQLLFKSDYASSAKALSVLVWACVIVYPNIMLVNGVIALRKQVYDAAFSFLSLLANVLLNLWWIPLFGFLGAAWATVVAEIIQFTGLAWYLSIAHGVALPWRATAKLLPIGAGCLAGGWAMMKVFAWPVTGTAVLILYLGLVLFTGALNKEDRNFLWEILKGLGRKKAHA